MPRLEIFERAQKIIHNVIFPNAKFTKSIGGELVIHANRGETLHGYLAARTNIKWLFPSSIILPKMNEMVEIETGMYIDHEGNLRDITL